MPRALPTSLLRFAEVWLDSCDSKLIWLIGEPGAGKSTLLRACCTVRPVQHVIELGGVCSLIGSFGFNDGGLSRLGRVAEQVRTEAVSTGRPTIITACSLPPTTISPRHGESVFVLLLPEELVQYQRQLRPRRTCQTADPSEAAYHRERVIQISTMRHVRIVQPPHLPVLLGAESEGVDVREIGPATPLSEDGE